MDSAAEQTSAHVVTSNTTNNFSSPFDNFLHYAAIPKDHESAARQALYNAVAFAVLVALSVAVFYALVVLEPFLLPILWAVLTGFVLHPYKAAMTSWLKKQRARRDRGHLLRASFDFVMSVCDAVGDFLFGKMKILLCLAFSLASLVFVVKFQPGLFTFLWDCLQFAVNINVFALVDKIKLYQVFLLAFVMVLSLYFVDNAREENWIKIGFNTLWLVIICYILNFFWAPLITFILPVSVVLTVKSYFSKEAEKTDDDGDKTDGSAAKYLLVKALAHFVESKDEGDARPQQRQGGEPDNKTDQVEDRVEELKPVHSTPAPSTEHKIEHPGVSALKKRPSEAITSTPQLGTSKRFPPNFRASLRQQQNSSRFFFQHRKKNSGGNGSGKKEANFDSSVYIRSVLSLCVLIQFYLHPVLLHLLPIPISLYIVRKIASKININGFNVIESIGEWIKSHRDILFPSTIKNFTECLRKCEEMFVNDFLVRYSDSLVAAFLIVSVIVICVTGSVFISLEVYAESLHLVQNSGHLVSKFSHRFNATGAFDMEEMLESGYRYGRDFISNGLKDFFTGHQGGDELEVKVLELWDRLYQYWLQNRMNNTSAGEVNLPKVDESAISNSFDDILRNLPEDFNVVQFCKDNMGTFVSIVDHAWSIFKGNFGLVISIALELVRILMTGGSGVVNFFLSVVVYLTALFYLLSDQGKTYKPVDVMNSYAGVLWDSSAFGEALNKAVNGIFRITFKMASFYGLWTYLTHVSFRVSLVTLPVLMSAFLAVIPVAGQYLIAAPGALELWLMEDRPLSALALFTLHVLPCFFVDTSIYTESGELIHPYLTGLSIVGGIYYFGVAGAIYGPLILCAVFVVLSMYPNFMGSNANGNNQQQNQSLATRLNLATPALKRSESIY